MTGGIAPSFFIGSVANTAAAGSIATVNLADFRVKGNAADVTLFAHSFPGSVESFSICGLNCVQSVTAKPLMSTSSLSGALYATATNCSSSAAPAVCAAAPAGSVVIAAAATTVTVNTTAVTANSQITVFEDSGLGTKLSVTCNTTIVRTYAVTARTAATSFVITTSAAPTTNPACLSYSIVN